MNAIRKRILSSITRYPNFTEYKDLIGFCICGEYFMNSEDEDNDIEPDFDEVVVIVEKDWLFQYMKKSNPLEYLQNEYTSNDSFDWFSEAIIQQKVVMIEFN